MENEYYDSLEDEYFSDCQDDVFKDKKIGCLSPESLSKILPLYEGEISKTELESRIYHDSLSNRSSRPTKKFNILPPVTKKKPNSYLKIFYDKIKLPGAASGDYDRNPVKHVTPSARATCRSTKRDDLNESMEFYADGEEELSDDEGFFHRFLENTKALEIKNRKGYYSHSTIALEAPHPPSNATLFDGLQSVSEQCLSRRGGPPPRQKHVKRKIPVPTSNIDPAVIASNDKLNQLRKRLLYGQRVSDKNKIRLAECQMVRELNRRF